MDQYAGNLPTSSSYSPLPSIAPQQLQQQNASLPPHTLPPLQAQHNALSMHPMYGQPMSAPHTPISAAPNTAGTVGNGGFQHMSTQPASRGYRIQGAPYQPSSQPYSTSSSMIPQSSVAMSHPQPIAPAPAQASSHNRLVPLRPMTSAPLLPQNSMHSQLQSGMSSPYGQQSPAQDQETPTHVVGSQGRRGILPSAPGRPTVSATGPGSTKNALIPTKDADGKFPCPHCTKTYLHAKHLKRHLLRHTGDRPYMCVLCRDTFSRSDILKRHFQKCSIRRGNPTGASHLSHAQAHLKKSHHIPQKNSGSASSDGDLMRNINGMNNLSSDSTMHPFGVIPDLSERRDSSSATNLTDEQASQEHLSRSDSLKRMSTGGGRDRRSMTGPGPAGSARTNFDQQNFSGDAPTTMTSSMNPQLTAFSSMPNGHNGSNFSQNFDFASQSNGAALHSQEDITTITTGRGSMPMYGGAANAQQQSGLDWSQIFQPGAQDGFMSPFNPSLAQNQMAIKAEPPMTQPHDGLFTGMYPITTGSGGPAWMSPSLQSDPLQQTANRITNFCFPPRLQSITTQAKETRKYLTVDNIKHFLEQFTNFQGHFPIIHMPTFRVTEAYEGLLLAMICIGAVYSDRITPPQVRELMEHAKVVVERDSRLLSRIRQDLTGDISFGDEMTGGKITDLEEFQAISLLQSLYTWHGTPVQREIARRNFHLLVKVVHAAGFTRPSNSPRSFSILHQQNVSIEHFSSVNFDWNAWIEQEKRSRLFYTIFLYDATMALYFNIPPQFDSFDIRLPLPADDAAWDARTAIQCADALGLNGSVAAGNANQEGTCRAKQPELSSALTALIDNGVSLKSGTTNVYSKFILIHALHVQIFRAQRVSSQNGDHSTPQGMPLSASGTSTPTSQNEWAVRSSEGSVPGSRSSNVSRRATPVDIERNSYNSLVVTNNALDKWKKIWDEDMATQYPPSSTNYRRFGFCRDSVHFFYLAKYLLKDRLNWQIVPDQRFTYVMHLLKSVKNWVVSDSAQRGEELGSVSDIDQDYGVKDLTLDMAQLFKPINKRIDSPIPGVHTNIGNGVI